MAQGREREYEFACDTCKHEKDIHRLLKDLLDGNGELPLMRRFDVTEKVVEDLAIIINGTPDTSGLKTHWIETNASFNTIKKLLIGGIALGTLIAAAYAAYFAYLAVNHKPIGEERVPSITLSQPQDAGLPKDR